ncbi:hypothetical protein [Streptosporangium soli]
MRRARVRGTAGDAGDVGDVGVVKRAAASPPAPRVMTDGTVGGAAPVTVGAIGSSVARDAVELLTGPPAPRVRGGRPPARLRRHLPAGPAAVVPMERCENRDKVRAHRGRGAGRLRRDGTDTPDA